MDEKKAPRELGADSTPWPPLPRPEPAWRGQRSCQRGLLCLSCLLPGPPLSPSSSTPDCNVLTGIVLSLWRPLGCTFITKLFPLNTFQEKEKHTHTFRKQKIGRKQFSSQVFASLWVTMAQILTYFLSPLFYVEIHFVLYLFHTLVIILRVHSWHFPESSNSPSAAVPVSS